MHTLRRRLTQNRAFISFLVEKRRINSQGVRAHSGVKARKATDMEKEEVLFKTDSLKS